MSVSDAGERRVVEVLEGRPSFGADGDLSPIPRGGRVCRWCGVELDPGRSDRQFCGKRHRQAAYRLRRQLAREGIADGRPRRLAYADPPFPGKAYLYRGEPTFAGEVDHEALVAKLMGYDGWALSTSSEALRDVLSLIPRGTPYHTCAWVKPIGVSSKAHGMVVTWEPIIVVPAREMRPGKRDWLRALPARGGGTLIGRKPLAFCAALFGWLGASPGDELDDLFPGTGVVGKAWSEFQRSSAPGNDVSLRYRGDPSPVARADLSPAAARDPSPRTTRDSGRPAPRGTCRPEQLASPTPAGDFPSREVLGDALGGAS